MTYNNSWRQHRCFVEEDKEGAVDSQNIKSSDSKAGNQDIDYLGSEKETIKTCRTDTNKR
jgi:hypothetical protein